MPKRTPKDPTPVDALLIEVAWEVCNQIGGIYTVIRSKAPVMVERWRENYCLVGPLLEKNIHAELEPLDDDTDVFSRAAAALRKRGYDVVYAEWLITGKPRVVLLNPRVIQDKERSVVKYLLWKNHSIETHGVSALADEVISFAYLTKLFIDEVVALEKDKKILAHFHEWMAGLPILDIKRDALPVKTLFTTHATQLGRHLAINSPMFYAHLPFFRWEDEAKKFGIALEAGIEYACAQLCDVFTTVSEVTARECKHILRRQPNVVLPNGLNIQRFEALHEFQVQHSRYKEKIHQFVMGHFFQSYAFDLDKTIYLFTSGRYEYKNKGFDLTLEALWHLNEQLKHEKADLTVVMFFVTKRDCYTIRPDVLQSRAVMEEIRQTCEAIQQQVGRRLFYESTTRKDHRLPDLSTLVDDYWKLRYRRTIQSWKTTKLPLPVTHKLKNEDEDEILQFLTRRNLLNREEDKVKIVYHPDFINSTSPLFGLDYTQFVRGCNLGVFPSYYEPWGYTPLECMASGVPSVTSDLSGFGDYVLKHMTDHEKYGMYVVERGKRTFDWSAKQLAGFLYSFLTQSRKDRIMQRNKVENHASAFDWENLISWYDEAYAIAMRNN